MGLFDGKFADGRLPLSESYRSYRSQRLRSAQNAKLAAVFAGKVFEVIEKIDWTQSGRRFHTPLGHYGFRGYRLVEVGNPGNEVFLGETTLDTVRNTYQIVDRSVGSDHGDQETESEGLGD